MTERRATVPSRLYYRLMDRANRNTPLGPNSSVTELLVFYFNHTMLQVIYLIMSIVNLFLYQYHRMKLRILMITYHHNRAPQLIRNDVRHLSKLPKHVAIILQYHDNEEGGGIDGLLDQTADITAWCLGAGIPLLSIYERTGILKDLSLKDVERVISKKLQLYYGTGSIPRFHVTTPGLDDEDIYNQLDSLQQHPLNGGNTTTTKDDIKITILSESDGRETIVELSKTLAELAVAKRIRSKDINVAAVDTEMRNLVIEEPDLLVVFGPTLDLEGFPPWQIRLSEIFYQPDNDQVSYSVFLKSLEKYGDCKINVGR